MSDPIQLSGSSPAISLNLTFDGSSAGAKKRWARIVPVIFAVNTMSFFDRVNLGMAMPSMSRELGLGPAQAGFAAGILFWGYIISIFASGWIIPRFGAYRTLLVALVAWGIIAMAMGLTHNYTELLVFRFLLGLAEGPVFAAPIAILSQWFLKSERAKAFGLWNIGIPFASLIVGPISGFILTFSDWHYMLILEGLPTLLVALAWWRLVPPSLEDAAWLNARERRDLRSALAREQEQAPKADVAGAHWFDVLRLPVFWLILAIICLMDTVLFSFAFWFPTMVKSMGSTSAASFGLLSSLLYVLAIPSLLAITYSSDRHQERRIHASVSMFCLSATLLLAASLGGESLALRMASFTAAGFFLFMWMPLILVILAESFSAPVAVAASAMIGGVGTLVGGSIGPVSFGWIYQRTNDFTIPLILVAACSALAAVLALFCRRPEISSPKTSTVPVLAKTL